MGVRRYNVECGVCSNNFDLIFSGDDVTNYGFYAVNFDVDQGYPCQLCGSSDISSTQAHDLSGQAFKTANQGDHDKALELIMQALKQSPYSACILNQACNVYTMCGDYEKAIEYGLQSSQLAPEWMDPLTNIADAYVSLGRYSDAIELYQKAITLDPQEAHTYGSLGTAYSLSGDHLSAINNYEEFLGRGGRAWNLLYDTADEYMVIGNPAKAKEVFILLLSTIDTNSNYAQMIRGKIARIESMGF